jgi:hypothetical protein
MCITSNIKFNSNNTLLSITDCIIIISTFSPRFFCLLLINNPIYLVDYIPKIYFAVFHLMCLYMCTWISVFFLFFICASVCLLYYGYCVYVTKENNKKNLLMHFFMLYSMSLFVFITLCSWFEMCLKMTSIFFLSSPFLFLFSLFNIYSWPEKKTNI